MAARQVLLVDARDLGHFPESQNAGLVAVHRYLAAAEITTEVAQFDTTVPFGENQKHSTGYDIVLFALYHSNYEWARDFFSRLKSAVPGVVLCIGSRFVTENAEDILKDIPQIDFALLGNGEYGLAELLEHDFAGGKRYDPRYIITRGVAAPAKAFFDENKNIVRNRGPVLHHNGHGRLNIAARIAGKRGCSQLCTFCSVNSVRQRTTKKLVAESGRSVLDEMEDYIRNFGFHAFMFYDCPLDDGGTIGTGKINELCDGILERGYKLAVECLLTGHKLTTADLTKMRRAGFFQVMVLLGSGNAFEYKLLKKKTDFATKQKLIDALAAAGIDTMFEFFAFTPYTTRESLARTFAFLQHNRVPYLGDYLRHVPIYKGTPLYELAQQDELLGESYSFHRPYNYSFREPEISRLSATLGKWHKSELLGKAQSFSDFIYFFNWMRPLLDEQEAGSFMNKIDGSRSELATIIGEMLLPVFGSGDPGAAEEQLIHYEPKLAAVYDNARGIQFDLLRLDKIRDYSFRSIP